ncbi:UDP-N-acetylmuramoyl-tripeptide--D-alanyl-D-alanine ligase [Aeromicrobium marinum DSM 15272]|uniref:UDP-N-acetylmuramoyl-tripeptide--D-alanyl-D-alanine ligase n=1 Tax=Aeromicrobium marinum DSM 15272 TaxID=585531 RepID=E2S968_9ACTN|nr:UDP-N-acetylmuramoyl-tripeptide--D-alanyl-D-alanine ligase [Aeromicrobium marinum]EFQ84338.1 UDP-N-acetylmuramoyl-tripeptide--D-alanyl-D-alanine ligase [Aeromicrobium marinum DSM 15272]
MIELDLEGIAAATGGTAHGRARVTGPATIDSRDVPPGGLFVAIPGEHVDGHAYAEAAVRAGAAAVLCTRPVAAPHVLVPDATVALGLLARATHDRLDRLSTVGLTGSSGKTSTKDLLAHVLEPLAPTVAPTGSFNNELGVPLTVLRADPSTRYLVVEMGARGRGHIAALCRISPPDVAVVLNVGTAHQGEFGSVDDTAVAKGELVEALGPGGTAVLNADDPRVAAMAGRTAGQVLTFGRGGDVRLVDLLTDAAGHPRITLAHGPDRETFVLPQIGGHHGSNAAATAAVAVALGVDLATVAARLATATVRSPHRMARHVRPDGLVVVDDSYNANPESVAAALRSVADLGAPGDGGRTVVVLGEMLELGADSADHHRRIGALARELGIGLVVAVGPGASPVVEGAGALATGVPDVAAAVELLHEQVGPGDLVLVKASRSARLERVVTALLADARHTSEGV